jgi:hypothetical protein
MSDDDKLVLDLYLEDTLNRNATLKRDDEFKKMMKEELLKKIEEEDEFDDLYKEDGEALTGLKAPETSSTGLNLSLYEESDDGESGSDGEDKSPTKSIPETEASDATTRLNPSDSGFGELTVPLRGKPGRPAKDPAKIAERRTQLWQNYRAAKKFNKDIPDININPLFYGVALYNEILKEKKKKPI